KFKEMDEISHIMSLTDILDIKKTEWGLEIGKLIDKNNIPEDSEELKRLREYALSKDMYRGSLVSNDGKITVIIARLKEDADQIAVGRQMKAIVKETRGDGKIYYGGIPFQQIFLTDIVQKDLGKLIPLVIILVIIILFISFRSLRGVFLPLSCVLISTVWTVGIMSILKIPLNIASDAIPVLLVAIGSAYGIHMLSKYNEDVRHGDTKIQGIKDALSEVGIPILLAGITTLIGFLAFLSSNLSPIREFGVLSAIGVMFAMIISVTFLPAVLSFLKVKRIKPSAEGSKSDWSTRMMDKLGGFVLRNALQIVIGSGIFVVFALLMIPRISREVNMVDYFKKDSEIRQAEEMMESNLGGSIPVQILVEGDLKDPFVLKEMLRFEKFLDARPNISDPQSIADLICEMNWVMNGHYTIPETREGVANLWFFIEGNEVLDQLITDDDTEALIQAKLGTVNTKQMLALVSAVEEYINSELRTDLITVEYSLASPELAEQLAKERVERILSTITWDIEKRGFGWNANNPELKNAVTAAVTADSGGFDDNLINNIATKIGECLRSEDADILIESENVIAAIVIDICNVLHLGSPDEENIVAILENDVPRALYAADPEALDYAAETIVAIIADEAKWARTNRLIDDIKPFLPEKLRDDEDFLGDMRDNVWEINEDRTAIASSNYARLSGKEDGENQTELSAQQTGMPIIYMDLDKKIMRSQAFSLSIAIFLVFILLAYRLKSFIGGLISITPIVLTILFNFTIMSIFRIPLDVVTVLIGSVAVGIGIDYTIHFITRFKVEHARGKTEIEALDKTLETTGKAIVINALSVMMGFLVLILGNIVPMQRFGYLIALTMVVSAVASITVLPALLLITRAGFVGRLDSLKNGLVSKVKGKIDIGK
ncbi:MAG: MMPL family transporter, partial [Victivallales bacterium]|nr:MMPL family transporter [Victivallales bacterium]